jgi:hypothetical protein
MYQIFQAMSISDTKPSLWQICKVDRKNFEWMIQSCANSAIPTAIRFSMHFIPHIGAIPTL